MLDPRNDNISVYSSSSSWQLTNRFSVTLTYVPKILSGIDTIDKSWGGMYQGGSYMCYGHASHGRGLLGMLFLQMGVLLEEKALFFSPGKPQDWKIQAASVDFDLDKAQRDRRVRLVWIPAVAAQQGFSDAMASKAIEDLVRFIKSEAPDRVLINDFMPFLQFRSFDRFRQMFGWMMGQLSNGKTTTLLLMPDIINAQSRQIIEFMRNQLAGSMHVSMPEWENETPAAPTSRRLVLLPGLGHVTREVFDPWALPVLGVSRPEGMSASKTAAGAQGTTGESFGPAIRSMPEGLAEGGSIPSVAIDSLQEIEVLHEAFFNRLKLSFKQRATKKYKPFLLVALRLENSRAGVEDTIGLEMLLPAIQKIVSGPDDLLVDVGRQRIIAFLPNKDDDNVQEFFESVQQKLREEYPSVADQLPHVVSAVVVPNGEPFENPHDFLAYALEGN